MLAQRHDQDKAVDGGKAKQPDDDRDLRPGRPHQHFVREELAAAREVAAVALDGPTRGVMAQVNGLAAEADISAPHGTAPRACRSRPGACRARRDIGPG